MLTMKPIDPTKSHAPADRDTMPEADLDDGTRAEDLWELWVDEGGEG
jgi:hypothetical protein